MLVDCIATAPRLSFRVPKIQDYACPCGELFEYMSMGDADPASCPKCLQVLGPAEIRPGGHKCEIIIPMYNGSLRQKAGHVHTHGDRPAEKRYVTVPRAKGES